MRTGVSQAGDDNRGKDGAQAGLAQRFCSGDHNAMEEVYEKYWDFLFRIANDRMGRKSIAEEAVQEAFLAAWQSRTTFDPQKGSLLVWLKTIVLNECTDAAKQESTHPPSASEAVALAADTGDNDEEPDHQPLDAWMKRVLSPEQVLIFDRRNEQPPRTFREIAEELTRVFGGDWTEHKARNWNSAGKRKIANTLQRNMREVLSEEEQFIVQQRTLGRSSFADITAALNKDSTMTWSVGVVSTTYDEAIARIKEALDS